MDGAIIGVHHSGLSDNARARGSSALRAAVDVEMVTERSPSTRTVMLKCTKAKDMPEFEPITFEALTVTLPWQGEDGQPETSFVMRPCDPPTDTRTADVARLKAEGKSIRDIAKELKISKSTADRIAQAADRYTKASRGE